MGLTKHQRIGTGILLVIFVSGLINILVGAPKLNPGVNNLTIGVMCCFLLIAIAVAGFYTWFSLRQLLPSRDYVRPERLSVWQKASLIIPITFVCIGGLVLWNHLQSGGLSAEQDPEMQVIKLWLLTVGCTIVATIATVAGVIWHKWQMVESNQETPIRDMFLAAFPKLVTTELHEVLKEGKLRADLREAITSILNDIKRDGDGDFVETLAFTNAFETRHSKATVFYTGCLDRLGHELKKDREYVEKNHEFRFGKTPAHLLVTHEPAGGYVSHFVAHDRRTGVLIVMSWPYRAPTPSGRRW